MPIPIFPEKFTPIDPQALNNLIDQNVCKPEELINMLMTNGYIRSQMRRFVITRLQLELEAHTIMVLGQFEKYYHAFKFPSPFKRGLFRLVLALHDIGKPEAMADGDKREQHRYTVPAMTAFFRYLGLSEEEIKACEGLIKGDPLGYYLKERIDDPRIAASAIRTMAHHAGMPVEDFWKVLLVYYKVDAGAYTSDAGWRPALDHVFDFSYSPLAIGFQPEFEGKIRTVKNLIL